LLVFVGEKMKSGEFAFTCVVGAWLLQGLLYTRLVPTTKDQIVEGESVWKGGKKFESRVGKVTIINFSPTLKMNLISVSIDLCVPSIYPFL
jgi:hypothetical protein